MKSKGTSSPTDLYAKSGFSIATPKYDLIDISANDMSNLYNSINVTFTWVPTVAIIGGGTYPSQILGLCSIHENNIKAVPTGASLGTQRVNIGISLQSPAIGGVGSISRYIGNISIASNTFTDVYNGIYVNHAWPRKPYEGYAIGNTINLRLRPSSAAVQYGINYTNCARSSIFTNTVNGPSAILSEKMKAYYFTSSSGPDIGCNWEAHTGRGFEFYLGNPGTRWHDNKMEDNLKGMVLNGGVIGPQTYPGHPAMGNQWNGSGWSSSNVQTYVYNGADATSSKIYVEDDPLTNPTVNEAPFGPHYSNRYLASVSIFTVSPTLIDLYDAPCGTIISAMVSDTTDVYTQIARQHVPYVYNVVPNRWISQFALWKSVLSDTSLTDSSAAIASFASMATSHSRYKYLTDIENDLAAGDLGGATTKLSYNIDSMANTDVDTVTQARMADDTSADFIVQNYQQFYTLYIKYLQESMDGSDTLSLLALASLCPEINGGVVYQSRALYSFILNDLSMFDDDSCLDADTAYIAEKRSRGENAHDSTDVQKYSVYPNPNSGNFTIQQYIKDEELIAVSICDALGRNILRGELQFSNNKSNLDINNVGPGIYILEIKDSKNRIFRFKIIVDK